MSPNVAVLDGRRVTYGLSRGGSQVEAGEAVMVLLKEQWGRPMWEYDISYRGSVARHGVQNRGCLQLHADFQI